MTKIHIGASAQNSSQQPMSYHFYVGKHPNGHYLVVEPFQREP